MEDQEQISEDQEVATPELEQDELTEADNTDQEDSKASTEAESYQDRNWRAMQRRHKEMEWQLKQKDELLEKVMQVNQYQQAQQVPAVVEEPEMPDDEFPSAGGVRGIARKTVQPLEKKIKDLEEKIAQQEQIRLVNNLRTQFPDFDDVVNVETLEILEKQEPELADTISRSKDPYKMGIQSYKYIKALGLANNLPTARRAKEVEKKIEKNAKTVQSPMSFDKRPMAQAFKSTAADKKRLYEEMMHYAGGASGL